MAVYVDDMKELWARDMERVYIRQFTTHDGRWREDSELDPHLDENLAPRNIAPEAKVRLTIG